MPRRPKGPWKRSSDGKWYVKIRGKQICLGDDEDAAWDRFYRLMGVEPQRPAEGEQGILLGDLVGLFLESVESSRSPRTYQEHNEYLTPWANHVGLAVPVAALRAHHLKDWVETMPPGRRRNCIKCVKRCFNWALDGERIDRNPFARIKRGKYGSRQVYLTADEQAALMAYWPPPFQYLVVVSLESGVRPQEIIQIEARHVHDDQIVIPAGEHKTGDKTGEPRVIYLTDKAREIVTQLAEKWPKGPIFRNRLGRPWDKDSIGNRFKRARKAGKIPPGVCATVLRHSFATSALKAGINPEELRVLMGHSSLEMISRHYSHIGKDKEHMQEAAKRARLPRVSSAEQSPPDSTPAATPGVSPSGHAGNSPGTPPGPHGGSE